LDTTGKETPAIAGNATEEAMTVKYEIDGAVGVVTLSKPPRNLLDDGLLENLTTAYEKVVAEGARRDCRRHADLSGIRAVAPREILRPL
jgi:hypothetical protein